MNPILAPAAAPLIERVAHDRALLAFDLDGTLAPMVEDFREARLRQVQAWSAALETAFRDEPGVHVERKETTLAVHYRLARDPEVCRRVVQAAAALPGARVFGGYEVLNVAPLYAPTKGDVLEVYGAPRSGERT